MKPDFNNVDVRKSRETPYDSHPYVTSDLNPGFVFIGAELEFNPEDVSQWELDMNTRFLD